MDMASTNWDTRCFEIAYRRKVCSLYPHVLCTKYETSKPERRHSKFNGLYSSLKSVFLKVICIKYG